MNDIYGRKAFYPVTPYREPFNHEEVPGYVPIVKRANIETLANDLKTAGVASVNSLNPIGITDEDVAVPHIAQKWIAEKKSSIAEEIGSNPQLIATFGRRLGIRPDGGYAIKQSGNLTKLAAFLYNASDFKRLLKNYSENVKEQRKEFLAQHPSYKHNLEALRASERPLRNDIYEMEQIDAAEFPEIKDAGLIHPHGLNYTQPSAYKLTKWQKANMIPVFPEDMKTLQSVRQYGLQQAQIPVIPQGFKFTERSTKRSRRLRPDTIALLQASGTQEAEINNLLQQYQGNDQQRAQAIARINQIVAPLRRKIKQKQMSLQQI